MYHTPFKCLLVLSPTVYTAALLSLLTPLLLKDVPKTPNHSKKNNMRFIVNFAPEMKEIISEAKYLGLLGYSVPPVALNVALQEYKLIR